MGCQKIKLFLLVLVSFIRWIQIYLTLGKVSKYTFPEIMHNIAFVFFLTQRSLGQHIILQQFIKFSKESLQQMN